MPYKRLSKVTKEKELFIVNNYKIIGCYALAEQLNLHPKTVYRYAKKYNLPDKSIKYTADYIDKTCIECSNVFKKSKRSITKNQPGKFCSQKCQGIHKRKSNSKINEVLELANNGLKNKEISQITGYPMGSIASWLNKAKYRRSEGVSSTSIRNKFLKNKNCEICNFNRIVEMCHIIPASKGGSLDSFNLLALCPNHHYLFDHNKLTEEEFNKIKEKIEKVKK